MFRSRRITDETDSGVPYVGLANATYVRFQNRFPLSAAVSTLDVVFGPCTNDQVTAELRGEDGFGIEIQATEECVASAPTDGVVYAVVHWEVGCLAPVAEVSPPAELLFATASVPTNVDVYGRGLPAWSLAYTGHRAIQGATYVDRYVQFTSVAPDPDQGGPSTGSVVITASDGGTSTEVVNFTSAEWARGGLHGRAQQTSNVALLAQAREGGGADMWRFNMTMTTDDAGGMPFDVPNPTATTDSLPELVGSLIGPKKLGRVRQLRHRFGTLSHGLISSV